MLSSTEREIKRLEALLEAAPRTELGSSQDSSSALPLSLILKSELNELLDVGGSRALTAEESQYVAAMLLLIPYFKELER